MNCFLYFITDGIRTRIGVSADPHRRALDCRQRLAYTFLLAHRDWAELYKQRLHYVLHQFRAGGDWFDCSPLRALQSLHNLRDQDPFNRMPVRRTAYHSIT